MYSLTGVTDGYLIIYTQRCRMPHANELIRVRRDVIEFSVYLIQSYSHSPAHLLLIHMENNCQSAAGRRGESGAHEYSGLIIISWSFSIQDVGRLTGSIKESEPALC